MIHHRILLVTVLIAWVTGSRADAQVSEVCRVEADAPRLDHVTLAVSDLNATSEVFRSLGFRIKSGRVHSDGLENRHVKFADGSGVELMTLIGRPGSAMARGYAERLSRGDGGAFVALWTPDLSISDERLRRANIIAARTASGAWQFLSFPARPDLDAVFIGAGPVATPDGEAIVAHENGALKLAAAWLEAGPAMDSLLTRLGGRQCGTSQLPDGRHARRWRLAQGTLVVARPPVATDRATLLGIELERNAAAAATPRLLEPVQGFWVLLR